MAAKPIKSLELHYTMIQFLIKRNPPINLKTAGGGGGRQGMGCGFEVTHSNTNQLLTSIIKMRNHYSKHFSPI